MCRRKKVWSIVTPPNFEFDCHKKKFVSVLFSYLRWLKFSGPRNLNSTTISSARYNKMVFALNKTGKGCYCDMKLCNARINRHILKEVFWEGALNWVNKKNKIAVERKCVKTQLWGSRIIGKRIHWLGSRVQNNLSTHCYIKLIFQSRWWKGDYT